MVSNVKFVAPRVPLVDIRTGQITREWYLLLSSLFEGTDAGGGIPNPVEDFQSTIFLESDPRIGDLLQEIAGLPAPTNDAAADEIAMQQVPPPAFDPRRFLEELAMLVAANPSPDIRNRHYELELMIAGAIPPLNPPLIASGSYTPTMTAVSNFGSSTPYPCAYLRI